MRIDRDGNVASPDQGQFAPVGESARPATLPLGYMATDERPRHSHPYHAYCACGALVWDSPRRGQIPRFDETIICQSCGADCSRKPLGWYQLWQLRREWRHLRRGWRTKKRQLLASIFRTQ